jgi:hypothetical protein
MSQTALSRLVRDDLPRTSSEPGDRLRIESYLYEMVVELSDSDTVAFLDGLEQLERSGEVTELVRSLVSRMIRLIECDTILKNWE